MRALLLFSLVSLTLLGCASHPEETNELSKKHTMEQRVDLAQLRNVRLHPDGVVPEEPYRFWEDEQPTFLLGDEPGEPRLRPQGERLTVLALSGGGANGAYGAGVLNGLSHNNQLPTFDVVTGISAGALIAPFAFLGDERLDELHEVMVEIDDKTILGRKNFLRTLFKDAFTSGKQILALVTETYPEEFIDELAEQHRLGRRLFIGTTHIEAGRLIIWNIGAIANSDLPNRIELIHQILAGSAAIPGVFPPQFIPVYQDGQIREEMHVDGGVTAQVFFDPSGFGYGQISDSLGLSERPKVYVVRNGFITVPYQKIKDSGVELLKRTVSNMMVQQTQGDLYRIGYFSEILDFEMAYTAIDEDFYIGEHKKMFEPAALERLYQYGYDKAVKGKVWQTPPQ
ncbi:patatin-like phospholipase family protein [Ferrimonas gelatinilytica]|uniref:Patatin-like phospholipase family protein n=1 Tax=Ferrimonas gelatinilytica TaxID=1255257 RepID=A0ABP9S8W6_9GAMM